MTCNLRTVNFFLWTVRSFTDRTNSTDRYSAGILDNHHFQMLDLFFKFLSAHHECNVVVYGLSCAKEATNKISTWCQPFRNIYNYTDYGNGTDGWKLYSVARDCVEVDDLCLSKERCKKTTQKLIGISAVWATNFRSYPKHLQKKWPSLETSSFQWVISSYYRSQFWTWARV